MKAIEMSFLCVQPIEIDDDLYQKIILKKTKFKEIDKYSKPLNNLNASMKWLTRFNTLYSSYRYLKEIDLIKVDSKYLERDLKKEKNFPTNRNNKTLNLSSYMQSHNYGLYYDVRFSYFLLIYEISFSFPSTTLENFLDYSGIDDNLNRKDLYNTIRNLIVKENENSILSSWGRYIQNSVIRQVNNIIKNIFHIKIKENLIRIPNNSCNISCFILNQNKNFNDLFTQFNELNKFSERITSDDTIKPLYQNSVYYAFYGRFHTIYIKKEEDVLRFQPLQFHIQYMWFLLGKYNNIMNLINLNLMQDNSIKKLQQYAKVINAMINRIELLNLHNDNFSRSIEIDYDKIYKFNEIKWSIPILLNSAQRYVNFFKDYLDRLFQQKNELTQKKQNNILLSITILQLVALISVWTDYLSLLNKKNLSIDKSISCFGTTEKLLTFNLYTPVIISGVIALIVAYLVLKKKH